MAALICKTVCQKSWKTEFFSRFLLSYAGITNAERKKLYTYKYTHIYYYVGTAFCPKPKLLLLLKASITSWKSAAAVDDIAVSLFSASIVSQHLIFFYFVQQMGKIRNLKENRAQHKFKFEYAILRHCNAVIKASLLNVNYV